MLGFNMGKKNLTKLILKTLATKAKDLCYDFESGPEYRRLLNLT